jgi:hypothetical protein
MDKNHFKHPVPRIGNGKLENQIKDMINCAIFLIYLGEFAPVGPTSFQFDIPPNAPITISPLVGTVEPGTVCILFRYLIIKMIVNLETKNNSTIST